MPRDDHLLKNEWIAPTAAILDYDGDDGNVTTLNHVLWMLDIMPNVTVADVMDISKYKPFSATVAYPSFIIIFQNASLQVV